jgi:Ca-activated chloride channel family protein
MQKRGAWQVVLALMGAAVVGCGDDAYDSASSDAGSFAFVDGGGGGGGAGSDAAPGGNNIDLGGAQDFGYFRTLLDNGIVPALEDFDAAGFFHEHYLSLPPPTCGEQVCLQASMGLMKNLWSATTQHFAMLHLGLNTPVTIDPNERPPLNLTVVVDTSGSMASGDKIGYVRQGLTTLIDALEDTDQMSLVTYSTTAQVLVPMGLLSEARQDLHAAANALEADGSTNLYGGLELGYQQSQLEYDAERQNRVIMMSDGLPTEGIVDEELIMTMSAGYNAEALGLTSIGLGTAFNAQLMRGLAEQGHGNHYFIEDTAAIEEVFTEELSYFTVPVAFDVRLELAQGSNYDFRRSYGSSFWGNTPTGGVIEVPSVFLAHRIADDDKGGMGSGGQRRGGGSALLIELDPDLPFPAGDATIAVIDVSFREPHTNEQKQQQVIASHPTPLGVPYFDSSDPESTHKTFVMLNIYMAIEEACLRFHQGNGTASIEAIMRVIAAVEDYNDEVEDVDMDYDLALLEQFMDVLEANGATPPANIDLPADPWPLD